MFNEDQPSVLPAVPRILCIGDVHGDLGRLTGVLQVMRVIDTNMRWTAEPSNTIVVQLGDQLDSASRGTDRDWETVPDTEVLKFMDNLDKIARMSGGRVLSLLGNHEVMNIHGDFTYVSLKSMQTTGGPNERESMFRRGGPLANLLAKRALVLKIGNILFCHGGLLPHHLDAAGNSISVINTAVRKYFRSEPLNQYEIHVLQTTLMNENAIIWTRRYFELVASGNTQELESLIHNVCSRLQAKHIIVGHNTVESITPAANGALWFVDAAFSRSYNSDHVEVLEILHDDDPSKTTTFRVLRIETN
jgi:hypothetical protein